MFLAGVIGLMALDYPVGTYTITVGIPIVALLLGIGWTVLKGSHPFAPVAPSYILTEVAEEKGDCEAACSLPAAGGLRHRAVGHRPAGGRSERPASATQVLTQWCADAKLADPAVIKAVRDHSDVAASAQTRALLHAAPDEVLRYRRVKLTCGSHVLSQADNWYRPSRLTPEMNQTLDTTDTSFGTVVKPLGFHRDTLAMTHPRDPQYMLQVKAVLIAADGAPVQPGGGEYTRAIGLAAVWARRRPSGAPVPCDRPLRGWRYRPCSRPDR